MVQNSPPRRGDREDSQAVNKWEKESHETTRELLKVKDRLIEVERNVSKLNLIKVVKIAIFDTICEGPLYIINACVNLVCVCLIFRMPPYKQRSRPCIPT